MTGARRAVVAGLVATLAFSGPLGFAGRAYAQDAEVSSSTAGSSSTGSSSTGTSTAGASSSTSATLQEQFDAIDETPLSEQDKARAKEIIADCWTGAPQYLDDLMLAYTYAWNDRAQILRPLLEAIAQKTEAYNKLTQAQEEHATAQKEAADQKQTALNEYNEYKEFISQVIGLLNVDELQSELNQAQEQKKIFEDSLARAHEMLEKIQGDAEKVRGFSTFDEFLSWWNDPQNTSKTYFTPLAKQYFTQEQGVVNSQLEYYRRLSYESSQAERNRDQLKQTYQNLDLEYTELQDRIGMLQANIPELIDQYEVNHAALLRDPQYIELMASKEEQMRTKNTASNILDAMQTGISDLEGSRALLEQEKNDIKAQYIVLSIDYDEVPAYKFITKIKMGLKLDDLAAKGTKLEKRISEIDSKLDLMRTRRQDAYLTAQAAEMSIRTIQGHIDQLESERIGSYKKALDDAQTELENAPERLQDLAKKVLDAKNDLDSAQAQVESYEKMNIDVTLATLQMRQTEIAERLSQLNADETIDDIDDVKEYFNKPIVALETTISTTKESLQAVNESIGELTQTIEEMRGYKLALTQFLETTLAPDAEAFYDALDVSLNQNTAAPAGATRRVARAATAAVPSELSESYNVLVAGMKEHKLKALRAAATAESLGTEITELGAVIDEIDKDIADGEAALDENDKLHNMLDTIDIKVDDPVVPPTDDQSPNLQPASLEEAADNSQDEGGASTSSELLPNTSDVTQSAFTISAAASFVTAALGLGLARRKNQKR